MLDLKAKEIKAEEGSLHGTAFLPCGSAGGSSTSAGGGSAFRRSRTDMASRQCGSARGRGDEQPERETKLNRICVS